MKTIRFSFVGGNRLVNYNSKNKKEIELCEILPFWASELFAMKDEAKWKNIVHELFEKEGA